MLQSLRIRNIVLIDELEIQFHPGMQVLTGETGAGKSIVVDAVNLVLGGRADKGLIRSGADKATVEAVFDVPGNPEVRDILDREGIEYDGRTVILYREMSAGGKNLCRLCGVVTPVSLLRELSGALMDIHGQHEHQFLMNPEKHLSFLDRMGGPDHQAKLEGTAAAFEAFITVHRHYGRLRKENEQKQLRMGSLERDLEELHAAALKEGEEEIISADCVRLRNSEKIVSVLRRAREALSLSGDEPSCLEKVKEASAALGTLAPYGEKIRSLAGRCESAYYELEEAAYELSGMIEDSDHDPQRLEKAEARLDLIRRMERKYGENLTAVLAEQRRLESEYEQLCSLEDRIEETAREHKRLLAAYRQQARELSASRRTLAKELETRMSEQLRDLGMGRTLFQVCFQEPPGEKRPMPRAQGDDEIQFMIAPNPGEPLRPLAKTASGGELSRLMLALKALEAEGSGVDCMVFDEIDTGISGRMAQAVAEKMTAISKARQVICVTHLPQIAAAADYEFQVAKSVQEERTRTRVTELDREGRIVEIARMISGAEGSGTGAETYARAMLEANGK